VERRQLFKNAAMESLQDKIVKQLLEAVLKSGHPNQWEGVAAQLNPAVKTNFLRKLTQLWCSNVELDLLNGQRMIRDVVNLFLHDELMELDFSLCSMALEGLIFFKIVLYL